MSILGGTGTNLEWKFDDRVAHLELCFINPATETDCRFTVIGLITFMLHFEAFSSTHSTLSRSIFEVFLCLQIELHTALVLWLIHVPSSTYYWFEMRLKLSTSTAFINSLQVCYSFVLRTTSEPSCSQHV